MTSRERIRAIIAGEPADRCGLWLGNPHKDTWPLLHDFFGTTSGEELRRKLHDDYRWLNAEPAYCRPGGKPIFDVGRKGPELGADGVFADCEDVAVVEDYDWPTPGDLDFTEHLEQLDAVGDCYRAGGLWSPFFHITADFFGMENYFIKMHTHPDVVHAVTDHVVGFYLEANRRLFEAAGDRIDGFFFGNDFGTQLALLISPAAFREFVFPHFRRLTELAHACGRQVILHSCGSVHAVIPDLIEMGVDALHPLQARAADMDAERLARDFGGRVAFIGGVDTQDLLVNASPEEVKAHVRRVKALLGPRFVVSPSHEAVLPNVPPANLQAMAEAALE